MFHIDVKKARKIKNISQANLVQKTGLSQSYISELETNSTLKNPTLKIINRIAEALEICPLEMIKCDCNKCKGE